ncbi:glycine/betaine ABC transporter substrate-binding protein [Bordetella genomosp. 10]|uniref:Glycine/betaine ABC transporter substrate-binding protein n=1 Tax=Bordetella genomosp. 10 TaxID=1416804 RepID=A0A261SM66_9BORD|nr:substrate-binding domain-containing protein [Bordetella genomosp. 10]OZI37870.1 glycine/betaine ABC transporter substrate-binding protein [Bordetella genomosp. 10]
MWILRVASGTMLGMAAVAAVVGAGSAVALTENAPSSPTTIAPPDSSMAPPWQNGRNNDAVSRGFEFTVPDADNLADFHGDPAHPALSLYVGGNYFFAMAPLVQAFEKKYPEYKGRLYWETLPPGLLVRQMKAGGRVTVGNMTWTVKPDVYLAGLGAVKKQIEDGLLQAPAVPYVTNTLTIMVASGNPKGVKSLADLDRDDVKLAMPNPEFEGIARQIQSSLEKAGGKDLAQKVYHDRVGRGGTLLTHIHHRQTPLWIMQGRADAGVTWQSEAMFQEQAGHPIGHVDIPAYQNTTAIYAGAIVKGTQHRKAAQRWLDFIRSNEGVAIFKQYGFQRYEGKGA